MAKKQKKSIFERVRDALERRGIHTSKPRYLGRWRATWGDDSYNRTAVIPAALDVAWVDILVTYFPNQGVISASLWEFGQGGQSESYRLAPESIAIYGNYEATATGFREAARDIREALSDYEELVEKYFLEYED
jgi:hypothetical protein